VSVIGGADDLQRVLNSVYAGAVKECESREHAQVIIRNGHHMAQAIVENVKIELLKRGLFVSFDAPPIVECSPSFGELADKNKAEGGCGCAPGTVLCPH
jgi:hypothetical protein